MERNTEFDLDFYASFLSKQKPNIFWNGRFSEEDWIGFLRADQVIEPWSAR